MVERTFDRGEDYLDSATVRGGAQPELNYLRLRCLEIAVRCWHPEDAVPIPEMMEVAQSLLDYVLAGQVPVSAPTKFEQEIEDAAKTNP